MRICVILFIFVVISSISCNKCSNKGEIKPIKHFGVSIWEPETIDPSYAAEEAGVTIARGLFEGLLTYPKGDGEMRPGCAIAYEVSEDGLVYTFRLRHDAKWSDGVPVTSYDFAFAWNRVLDPSSGSRSAPQLFFIEGAEIKNKGAGNKIGVFTPDPYTITVKLENPIPFFPQVVGYPAYFPVRKDIVERYGSHWTRPGNIVSNGAFELVEFIPNSHAKLRKNPYYWDRSSVKIEEVTFYFMTNEKMVLEWFRQGRIHWLKGTLPRDAILELKRTRPDEFHTDPVLCTYYVSLRVDKEPLSDIRVRKALLLSVDREKLVKEVLMGGQDQGSSFVPPVIEKATGYKPPVGFDFDPQRARELLAEYINEKGNLPSLVYYYNTGEGHRLIAEFLQSQWKSNLGLEVKVETTEWRTLLERLKKGEFQMARSSWCADFVDPSNFLEVFLSKGINNYAGFMDEKFDILVYQARKDRHRLQLLQEAEKILLDSASIIPLYHYTRIYLLSNKVRGFEPNLLDIHPLQYLDIQP